MQAQRLNYPIFTYLEFAEESLELAALLGVAVVVLPVDHDGALDPDGDLDVDLLVGPLPDAHVAGEHLLQVGRLPSLGVHLAELSQQPLGQALDPAFQSGSICVIAVDIATKKLMDKVLAIIYGKDGTYLK